MSKSLPHRFSEKSFRRYESIILQITRSFPSPVVVDPTSLGLSAETVRGRLRDAITSLVENAWQTKIEDKICLLSRDLVISLRPDGKVIAGTKDSIKSEEVVPFLPEESDVFDLTECHVLTPAGLLCLLAHHGLLTKRIKLRIDQDAAAAYMERFDIVLQPQPNPDIYVLL